MKVVCANLGEDLGYVTHNEAITIGKTYHVSQWQTYDLFRLKDGRATVENVILYSIINDEGKSVKYNKRLFVNRDEWRNKRINELGL